MAGARTPGRGRSHPVADTPRPMSHRGEAEVTVPAACPGRGWCAHAGAGEELAVSGTVPADACLRSPGRGGGVPPGKLHAPVVAGARTPGREGGHLTGSVPQPRPAHSLRAWAGGGGGWRRPGCPGRGWCAHAGEEGGHSTDWGLPCMGNPPL